MARREKSKEKAREAQAQAEEPVDSSEQAEEIAEASAESIVGESDETTEISAEEASQIWSDVWTEVSSDAVPASDAEPVAQPDDAVQADSDPAGQVSSGAEEFVQEAAAVATEIAPDAVTEEAVAAAEIEDAAAVPFDKLELVIESLLFVSNKALTLNDLKRLLREKDSRLINEALESLQAKRANSGVRVASLAGGWTLRSHPEAAPWAGKLLEGKPVRLSRAMLETLAIVAYRQPVTRPEIDEIRGVDAGPVLKTLLDRELIRIIGKKEDVGRPLLYGTTPEFLRVFSLKDLSELPTLREFHELTAENAKKVEAKHPAQVAAEGAAPPLGSGPTLVSAAGAVSPPVDLGRAPDPAEEDALLDELDQATQAATRAMGSLDPQSAQTDVAPAASGSTPEPQS